MSLINLKYLSTTMPLRYSKGCARARHGVQERVRADHLPSSHGLLIHLGVGIQPEKLEMFKENKPHKPSGLPTVYQQHQELNARNIEINKKTILRGIFKTADYFRNLP